MAQPDLSCIPLQVMIAFQKGEEQLALTLLKRARDQQLPQSVQWAILERLVGLLSIHLLREVEGTFALERADACLEAFNIDKPQLESLQQDK